MGCLLEASQQLGGITSIAEEDASHFGTYDLRKKRE